MKGTVLKNEYSSSDAKDIDTLSAAEIFEHMVKHVRLNNQTKVITSFYKTQVNALKNTTFVVLDPELENTTNFNKDSFDTTKLLQWGRLGIYQKMPEFESANFTNNTTILYGAVMVLLSQNAKGLWNMRVAKRATIGWKIPSYCIQMAENFLTDYINGEFPKYTITNVLGSGLVPSDEHLKNDVQKALKLLTGFVTLYTGIDAIDQSYYSVTVEKKNSQTLRFLN